MIERNTATNAAAAIRIEKLVKKYGGKAAVDGISFEVPVGSVFGLLGENGAGKSTTIKSTLGLVTADSGKVETLGLDAARDGLAIRRKVGYVPEQPGLYEWMTVAEIGWFASGFHPVCPGGPEGFQKRFARLVEGFELPPGRKIKALSKGMRAKVGLALALASEPALLVLDEPTSGLDAMVRIEFLESMVDLAGEGRTVLLSSHQIGEVERVASHVALIHQGKLVLAEPLDALKRRTFALKIAFDTRGRPDAPPPGFAVDLIDSAEDNRQARWLVHAVDRSAVESVRNLPGVLAVDAETPTLEEIYVAYMRRRKPTGSPTVAFASW